MSIPDLRPLELLALWSELDDALWGKNAYGGDTAELYAYRFNVFSPAIHGAVATEFAKTPSGREMANAAAAERTRRLFDLLTLFETQRECSVFLMETRERGRRLGEWLLSEPFDHRVHVRVESE